MMQTDARWRSKAREVLYNYTTNRTLLRRREQEIIEGQGPSRDHCYRRGGVSNPSLVKAVQLDDSELRELRAQLAVVDKLLAALKADGRRHRLRCLQLLDLVYFRHTHSLFYAACDLNISERTAKRMNSEVLGYIAKEMGWLDKDAEKFL